MFEYFISNLIYKVICSNQPSSFFEIQVYCFQSRWVSILDRIVSFSLFKKTIHLDKMETRIPQNQGSFASTNEYSPYSERTTEIIELYFIYIYKINLFNILEGKRIWGKLIKSVPFKDKNSCCNCIDFYFELFLLRKKKKCAKCKKDKLRMISSIPWIFNRTFIFEWRPDEIQINVINRRPFPISLISRLASWPIYINWISLRIVLDYRYIYSIES